MSIFKTILSFKKYIFEMLLTLALSYTTAYSIVYFNIDGVNDGPAPGFLAILYFVGFSFIYSYLVHIGVGLFLKKKVSFSDLFLAFFYSLASWWFIISLTAILLIFVSFVRYH